ncbi:hydroxyacid dehydrogenase [Streptomyces sp. NPDC049577]|uniref:hydroxyacid dehydrogenase n=1 Tax=Streptomyces sp. NPDC049577 TaxID=3155153 RepID=UPI00342AF2C9
MTEAREARAVVTVAMGADEAAAVLTGDLRTRLAEIADFTENWTDLYRADIVMTGWGSPALTRTVLDRAPRLRAVVHAAGSVKRVVTDAVWERGLVVSSAADANAGPVVDYACGAIALAAKRALGTAAAYERGWPAFGERQGADGLTVGVVGASRIGRRVIARLGASEAGYQVLLYDPYVSAAEAARLGVELVDVTTLCRASTIITLHAPELPETYRLLDAERLALIRDGGTVINTARGSLIDTEALTRECVTGRLDAFLDVTDPEPLPQGHPLPALPNVLVTPHIAGAQGSEVRRLGVFAVGEVERLLKGKPLLGQVAREELDRLA